MNIKRCYNCKLDKPIEEFYKKSKKSGLCDACKICHNELLKESRSRHTEESKERNRKYYLENKEKIKEQNKLWKKNNPDKVRESNRTSTNRRRKRNPLLRIRHSLNSRLLKKLKSKNDKTFDLIGCSPIFLKEYLEKFFEPEMSWENYGKDGWHIDHIVPCDWFDLTDKEEQKQCFHYTNLRPLWATTEIAVQHGSNNIGNINKSNTLIF